jgi:hypothetical protein
MRAMWNGWQHYLVNIFEPQTTEETSAIPSLVWLGKYDCEVETS